MESKEIIIIIIGGTLIMAILVIFIVSFFFVHQRRQQTHLLEKATLKARFEQETLNAKNEVQEATMQHIARELHDNVNQLLFLVKIQMNALENEVAYNKRIGDSREFLNKAISEISGFSKTLNSENILRAGLSEAISFEVQRIEKIGFINITFTDETDNYSINPKFEIIVFRMFQEILQNTIKHAKAKNMHVYLSANAEIYKLKIEDDGRGFDVKETNAKSGFRTGAGLANLKKRAAFVNGELEVRSVVGKGTTVILTLPMDTTPHDNRSPD